MREAGAPKKVQMKRKPKDWINRLQIVRRGCAVSHQYMIERFGYEPYMRGKLWAYPETEQGFIDLCRWEREELPKLKPFTITW